MLTIAVLDVANNEFIVPAQLHAIIDRAPQRSARWSKTKSLLALPTTLSLPVV